LHQPPWGFANERNQGENRAPPCVFKYRVPHGSHHANSFVIGPAVINTHTVAKKREYRQYLEPG